MVATAIYSVTMVLWKEAAFPLCEAMQRRWKRNVVSPVAYYYLLRPKRARNTSRLQRQEIYWKLKKLKYTNKLETAKTNHRATEIVAHASVRNSFPRTTSRYAVWFRSEEWTEQKWIIDIVLGTK